MPFVTLSNKARVNIPKNFILVVFRTGIALWSARDLSVFKLCLTLTSLELLVMRLWVQLRDNMHA